jgi:hypothetical protein
VLRFEIRAQHELATKAARLQTAVSLSDLIKGYPLGDLRPDGASRQQAQQRSKSSLNQAGCRARIALTE